MLWPTLAHSSILKIWTSLRIRKADIHVAPMGVVVCLESSRDDVYPVSDARLANMHVCRTLRSRLVAHAGRPEHGALALA
jgi:hypothetical protein